MKVYAIIECHYDAYFPNHIVLDGSAYLHEEDAEQAFKERQASQGGHILIMRPFNVIDRPKTSVTVLSSRMGFVCLSGQNMVDEEDSQIMLGPEEARKLADVLMHA